MPNDPAEYSRHFYAVLRELDGMNLRTIYIEMPRFGNLYCWA